MFISLNHRAKDDSIKSKDRVHRQILIIILPLIPQILHTFKSRLAVLRDHLSTTHTLMPLEHIDSTDVLGHFST